MATDTGRASKGAVRKRSQRQTAAELSVATIMFRIVSLPNQRKPITRAAPLD